MNECQQNLPARGGRGYEVYIKQITTPLGRRVGESSGIVCFVHHVDCLSLKGDNREACLLYKEIPIDRKADGDFKRYGCDVMFVGLFVGKE